MVLKLIIVLSSYILGSLKPLPLLEQWVIALAWLKLEVDGDFSHLSQVNLSLYTDTQLDVISSNLVANDISILYAHCVHWALLIDWAYTIVDAVNIDNINNTILILRMGCRLVKLMYIFVLDLW